MNINEIQTSDIIRSPLGYRWRVTAVNKGEGAHVLATMIDPLLFEGAGTVNASFSAKALLWFERFIVAA